MASGEDRLYFRQLLSGRDFAASDPIAQQMRNFAYLIGDRESGDAVVVDPAYSAGELVDTLEADGMRLSGVLVAWKGTRHADEEGMGKAAADEVGMTLEQVSSVSPFPAARDRHLHVYRKVASTPERFPRRPGMAAKRPLGR